MICEYIWKDCNKQFRSKARVIKQQVIYTNELPIWTCDASSCGMRLPDAQEIILKPVFHCIDPFRSISNFKHYLVLCETYNVDSQDNLVPSQYNMRDSAKALFDSISSLEIQFGCEQEYFVFPLKTTKWKLFETQDSFVNNNIGGLDDITNAKQQLESLRDNGIDIQNSHYCGIGTENVFGRAVAEQHLKQCLLAGISICGINAEVSPCQWEYQIGICNGIDAADQLTMSRYILIRVAELLGVQISFNPKPFKGANGSGCHVNVSTNQMRGEGGSSFIEKAVIALSQTHKQDIPFFGDNSGRLTGQHETSSIDSFTCAIASRNTSCRIPYQVFLAQQGYLECRRSASDMDPYIVLQIIAQRITQSTITNTP